jgi:hypothetical protein
MMRTFGPEIAELRTGLRKLHNEKLHNLCSSPDIRKIVKLRTMG